MKTCVNHIFVTCSNTATVKTCIKLIPHHQHQLNTGHETLFSSVCHMHVGSTFAALFHKVRHLIGQWRKMSKKLRSQSFGSLSPNHQVLLVTYNATLSGRKQCIAVTQQFCSGRSNIFKFISTRSFTLSGNEVAEVPRLYNKDRLRLHRLTKEVCHEYIKSIVTICRVWEQEAQEPWCFADKAFA